ncbi:ion channel [Bacillus kwashiorkori]|uniref:ion channel n=1 Tax=Bacillus kwashiorkori TaxID=1522318 RepID=UPI0007822BD1|nr:ion channel [Bacillus kwashiorkori]
MFGIVIFFVTILCIMLSIRTLFLPEALQDKYISWESFFYLLIVYSTIFIGFGMIYFIIIDSGFGQFYENGELLSGSFFHKLKVCFYFSGITLFSIGYGDISPLGLARGVAVIEGLIGYTIPAAFVVRTVIDVKKEKI